jgi:AcrR family transcriptional regulator
MEKMTKRQVQAQNTRKKIYKTSVELLESKGLSNITVEEICKVAGVSVGSFYNCFKSKNDILNEIYRDADDYFLFSVAEAINTGSIDERIINFFCYYADYVTHRGIDFIKHLYNTRNTMFIKKGRHMQTVLAKVIAEGQKSGELSSHMSPEKTVEYLFIAARGIVFDWCLYEGQYDLILFTRNYFEQFIKSLH